MTFAGWAMFGLRELKIYDDLKRSELTKIMNGMEVKLDYCNGEFRLIDGTCLHDDGSFVQLTNLSDEQALSFVLRAFGPAFTRGGQLEVFNRNWNSEATSS